MGNIMSNNEISISIDRASSNLYDFHRDQNEIKEKKLINYPSFIRKNENNIISY